MDFDELTELIYLKTQILVEDNGTMERRDSILQLAYDCQII
jgi:hypothetical protein